MRQPYQDELLDRHLKTYLRNVEPAALDEMRASLEWLEVPGGHTLMTQGEDGDSGVPPLLCYQMEGKAQVSHHGSSDQYGVREEKVNGSRFGPGAF